MGTLAPRSRLRCFALGLALLAGAAVAGAQSKPESLSAQEFVRLVQECSEEGGYFFSDNFTSNEDSYLTIVETLRKLGATGGAYVGVGPEQNFTYIAKVRPRIAFIVDIRRQAMIQHLMYKAIFQLAPTRAEFLSLLMSRPLPAGKPLAADAPLDGILEVLEKTPVDTRAFADNLAAIRRSITDGTGFPLSPDDQASLEYVYGSFRTWGFDVGFESGGRRGRGFRRLPNFRELLAQRDVNGKQGNFLGDKDDYDFVRGMHRRNLIVPVVGDFSGKKALAAVGAYLRKRGLTVSVFYLSNVEIVLLDWGSVAQFSRFAENVRQLPTTDRSLLIRSTFTWYGHPTRRPGYQLCTFLQKVSVFLDDFDAGRYQSYRDLIMTHYIGPDER